jgi:Mn-dependent DtxR family transcriptional regulator
VIYLNKISEEAILLALQESGQMYLESIYVLTQKNKYVRSIDVCEYMGFSKPSVSRAVGLLKEGEYIVVDHDGYITLTEKGISVAEKMYERHTILTNFLIKLGVDEQIAAADACKIEHHLSDESFNALKEHARNIIE